jgi:hypothetical protein
MLAVIIVEKVGTLKTLHIKDYKEEDLYKKCGFKNINGFVLLTEWKIDEYYVKVFGKLDGRANNENKYDFPPPIDKKLIFGNCVIVCYTKKNNNIEYVNLTLSLWKTFYENLFGGFEDLTGENDDDDEEDELLNVAEHLKTKTGYLKDGFVVSDKEENTVSDEDLELELDIESDSLDEYEEEKPKKSKKIKKSNKVEILFKKKKIPDFNDTGSELTEELYV